MKTDRSDLEEKMQESRVDPLFPDKGPNFVTFELGEASRGVLEYHPTKKLLSFNMFLSGLGALVGLAGFLVFVFSGEALALIGIPAGLVFFVIGLRLSAIAKLTRKFDSQRRMVTLPADPEKYRSPGRSVSFDQVDHLQIVEKTLNGGEDNDYRCCEFNVVLKGGARILIVQHPDKAALSNDGERIAKLLGCNLKIHGASR